MGDLHAARLVTTSDFDGWVCAILCRERRIATEFVFCDPYSCVESTSEVDIVANLGFPTPAYLGFDRTRFHEPQGEVSQSYRIQDCSVPSTARVVYRFFGGRSAFPEISQELMAAVDDIESAVFTAEEVLSPTDWHLLSALMDAKTIWQEPGLFSSSKPDWMLQLLKHGRQGNIEELLSLPLVQERTNQFREQQNFAQMQLRQSARVFGNLALLDRRGIEGSLDTSRFALDAILPMTNCSLQVSPSGCCSKVHVLVRNSAIHTGDFIDLYGWAGAYGGTVRKGEAWVAVHPQDADRIISQSIQSITGKSIEEHLQEQSVLAGTVSSLLHAGDSLSNQTPFTASAF